MNDLIEKAQLFYKLAVIGPAMNKDYKEMPWPATFHVFRDWQNVKPLNDVWGPIFADFQVVPNVWGVQDEKEEIPAPARCQWVP